MKLDKIDKKGRKYLINHFGAALWLRSFDRVTMAFIKTGPGRGKIAWSIHSENDGRFHRKYGEYIALMRLYDGGMPIEFRDVSEIPYVMEEIVGQLYP